VSLAKIGGQPVLPPARAGQALVASGETGILAQNQPAFECFRPPLIISSPSWFNLKRAGF